MAITAETRTNIIQLVVAANNAAPGTTLLTELVAASEGGASLADIAATLTASATFTSIYPSFLTAGEFAAEYLGNLVPEASDAGIAEGTDIIIGLLNGGATRADVVLEAATFLAALPETDPGFGTSAALFNNRVEVAIHHTITLELDTDFAGALTGVTSDDATVAAAESSLGGDSSVANTAASDAIAAAETAIVTATADDVTFAAAQTASDDAAATAALTDATALTATSDASTTAAATAVTDAATADAAVVTAEAALATAIAGGDPNAVSTANGTLIIAQSVATTAAATVTSTAATAATDLAATTAAVADDAAAATAATALADATTAILAS
ncbi:MAG: hypothetical protein IIB77_03320, partial [Proteobacteria bacterium]|nr:hypothetical protein [Pseudomonadota bacterium]